MSIGDWELLLIMDLGRVELADFCKSSLGLQAVGVLEVAFFRRELFRRC